MCVREKKDGWEKKIKLHKILEINKDLNSTNLELAFKQISMHNIHTKHKLFHLHETFFLSDFI